MFLQHFGHRATAIGAGLALLAAALPSTAQGAIDLSQASKHSGLHININITDKGFDPAEATLAVGAGPFIGQVTFTNTGTTVHSASLAPGSAMAWAAVNQATSGFTSTKKQVISNSFDTGGLGPGESATLGFSYVGDYTYTSSPDCLAPDRGSTGFNCTPAVIHAISYTGSDATLSSTLTGNTIEDPTKRTPHVDPNSSIAHPASGTVNISITDNMGYVPDKVYVTPGTTVVWTNNGSAVHSVQTPGAAVPPDNYNPLFSGGLGTGQTYSYAFNYSGNFLCNSQGPGACGGVVATPFTFQSNVASDLIPQSSSGFATLSTRSTMVGRVYMVVKCRTLDANNYCQM